MPNNNPNFKHVRIRVKPVDYQAKLQQLMQAQHIGSMSLMLEILIDLGIEALEETS